MSAKHTFSAAAFELAQDRWLEERAMLIRALSDLESAARLACRKQTTTSRPEHFKAACNRALDCCDRARAALADSIARTKGGPT